MQIAAPKRTLKKAIDLVTMQIITSDDLLKMQGDAYQVIRRSSVRARKNNIVRVACGQCGHAVYAPRHSSGQPFWKHHGNAPQDCIWWTGESTSIDSISARQFDGFQEGPLHRKIKYVVGELLSADPRTLVDSVVVDKYLVHESGDRRRPDVRATYDGYPLVIEVQLATTQIPIIVNREDFYEGASIRLLWLTWDFQPPSSGKLRSSFEDIFYSHDKNLFSIDTETIAHSEQSSTLILRVFWTENGEWHSKLASLFEMGWLDNGRANLVRSKALWRRKFLEEWRSATGNKGTDWRKAENLLSDLIVKLKLSADPKTLLASDVDSLINCLLSLVDDQPFGSRQRNIVEVLNTFLNVERRFCFAQLVLRFVSLLGSQRYLDVSSVRAKIDRAMLAKQIARNSDIGRIILVLFEDIFDREVQK